MYIYVAGIVEHQEIRTKGENIKGGQKFFYGLTPPKKFKKLGGKNFFHGSPFGFSTIFVGFSTIFPGALKFRRHIHYTCYILCIL